MTRLIVCGTPESVATGAGPVVDPSAQVPVRPAFLVPGQVCDVYKTRGAANALTDLVDDATGTAVTTITADAAGNLPATQLPDGLVVNGVWLDPRDTSAARFYVPVRFGPADAAAEYVQWDGTNLKQNGQVVSTPGGGVDPTALAGLVAKASGPLLYAADFGVATDGTDQTANLNAALAAAVTSRQVVQLPPGTVRIAGRVVNPGGTSLLGTGMWKSAAQGSRLLCTTAGAGLDIGVYSPNAVQGNTGGEIGNFTVDGNNVAMNPLAIYKMAQTVFRPIGVVKAAGNGAVGVNSDGTPNAGVYISQTQNFNFEMLYVTGCGNSGIIFDHGCGGGVIQMWEVAACSGYGVEFRQSTTDATLDPYNVPTNIAVNGGFVENLNDDAKGNVYVGAASNVTLNHVSLSDPAAPIARPTIMMRRDTPSLGSSLYVHDVKLGGTRASGTVFDLAGAVKLTMGKGITAAGLYLFKLDTHAVVDPAVLGTLSNLGALLDPASTGTLDQVQERHDFPVAAPYTVLGGGAPGVPPAAGTVAVTTDGNGNLATMGPDGVLKPVGTGNVVTLDQTARDAATAATATARKVGAETIPLMWAATSVDTDAEAHAWRDSFGSHLYVPFYWDRLQKTQGGAIDPTALADIRSWIAFAKTYGLRCVGELNTASAPDWYLTAAPAYKDQAGNLYTATKIRDTTFSGTARGFVQDFTAKFGAAFTVDDWAAFDIMRTGMGPSGELSFPPPTPGPDGTNNTRHWWIYSDAAGGSADLAPGMAPRTFSTTAYPFPNGTAATTAADRTAYAFVQDAMIRWMLWQVATLRTIWDGLIGMLHPSFGVRWEAGDGDINVRHQLAYGTDWRGQIAAYPDTNIAPWGTWLNRSPNTTVNGPQDLSPAEYLAKVAHAAGRELLFGENASGAPDSAPGATSPTEGGLDQVYKAVTDYGYRGVMLVYDTLVSNGQQNFGGTPAKIATLAHVAALQQANPAAGRIRTGPTALTNAVVSVGTPTTTNVDQSARDSAAAAASAATAAQSTATTANTTANSALAGFAIVLQGTDGSWPSTRPAPTSVPKVFVQRAGMADPPSGIVADGDAREVTTS